MTTAVDTPCRENPSLWDVDYRMTGVDITACIDACLHDCQLLESCRNYLADMDEQQQPMHGVIAGQYRAWGPDWSPNGKKQPHVTLCVLCGAKCVARSALARMPGRYAGYRGRYRNGLCHLCHTQQRSQP